MILQKGLIYTGGGKVQKTEKTVKVDLEWVGLILQAKEIGLKKEEVRFFLEEQKEIIKTINKG